MTTFGMALTIFEHEMELCSQLARPSFAAISLTNDLFSWEKERDDAKRDDLSNVINAVWVTMKELSMTKFEAKAVCREKIKHYVAESVRTVEKIQLNCEISSDLRIYIEALQYNISGNLVWSMYCPRYYTEISYNNVQLSMMKELFGQPDRNDI